MGIQYTASATTDLLAGFKWDTASRLANCSPLTSVADDQGGLCFSEFISFLLS